MSFGMVVGAMNKLANAMENGEYDFDGTHEKMVGLFVIFQSDQYFYFIHRRVRGYGA